MRALLDTSVLIPAQLGAHPMHERALAWLQRAHLGEMELFISAHAVAETYAGLTRIPMPKPATPREARRLITVNILSVATVVELTAEDYREVLARQTALGIPGGSIYDALIAWCARKAEVDHLVTFNAAHFLRVAPDLAERIVVPE